MHILLVSLMIATVLGAAYIAFIFPWDGDKKEKPKKFAGVGVGEKATKPKQYNG